ncbi:MAG: o-succinylbenzoate--CoA ligase [Chloroflexota bacterium]
MVTPFPSSDWLHWRALASPKQVALYVGDAQWTYGELDSLVNQMANWFLAQDLPQNRRVGILMQNSPEYVLLIYAAARLSLMLVTLNTRLTSAEIEWQIEFTECALVLVDIQNKDKVFDKIAITVPTVSRFAQLEIQNYLQPESFKNLGANSLQAIVFTSGTTGRPKAVPITFDQHFHSAMGSAYRLGVQGNDVWLSVLPLYHVGGMAVIFRSTLYGTAIDLHPRFDLMEINHALDAKGVTMISVVPTMLYRMIESRERWPESLRLILVGGAAASPELVAAAGSIATNEHPLISTTYGMTESASQFVTQTPADTTKKPASVGKPLLFNQLKIVDELGHEQPINEYGEIWVKGPVLMSGYLNNPKANAERFVDGWFCTGDIGMLDADGDLFVIQRRSDLIISGGENVYPAEVEAALRQHPAVKEACVVGVPNPEWGEIVSAMVELVPNNKLGEAELIAFARERLAAYKQPRRIVFAKQLPQTASGKIERKRVQEMMEH